jgi:hypothetical protein
MPGKQFPPEPIKVSQLDFTYGLAVLMAITSLTTIAVCYSKNPLATGILPSAHRFLTKTSDL